MKTVTILGATGSIGQSTLNIIARHPDKFAIHALSAHTSVDELVKLCQKFQPKYAVISSDYYQECKTLLSASNCKTSLLTGTDALSQIATDDEVDIVVTGIVGAAGLSPTLSAIHTSKTVLLANKEPLVMAGAMIMNAYAQSNAVIIPLDSEHNAAFQCMPDGYRVGTTPTGVSKLVLTASGGPFRDEPLSTLEYKTPQQACAHPTWDMGAKISVDSATMMNKGFEVIEAHWLFSLPIGQIEVVVHPQSVVHALVYYNDGSVLSHLGPHDMRVPIAHGLGLPNRIASGAQVLDLLSLGELTFRSVDMQRYPCLQLAIEAIKRGGIAPTVLNAVNEVTVAAFLERKIRFTDITLINEKILASFTSNVAENLDEIIQADKEARLKTQLLLKTQMNLEPSTLFL